jgi:hypothetical protein
MQTIDILDFDESKITINVTPKGKHGTIFYINYEEKYFPGLVMPNMKVASCKVPETDQAPKVILTFEGMERTDNYGAKLKRAFEKLCSINNKILQLLAEIAQQPNMKGTFYKNKFDPKAFEESYRAVVWESEDDKTGERRFFATLKLATSRENPEHFKTYSGVPLIVDAHDEPLDVNPGNVTNYLTRGSIIKPVVQPMYVFVAGKDFVMYSTWAMNHCRIQHREEKKTFVLQADTEGLDGIVAPGRAEELFDDY